MRQRIRIHLYALALATSTLTTFAIEAKRPNIVVILADDLGYGDVSCYNKDSKIPTPNLDRLAGEGMRFTDAHAAASVCTPSRYALLTGRYCWRSRLKSETLPPWGATLIEPGRLTVGALLQQHGYTTACIGKWHLGWQWPTKDGRPPSTAGNRLSNVDFTQSIAEGPITRGFDTFFGVDLPNYPPYCFIANDHTVGIPSVPDPGPPSVPYPGPEEMFYRPGPMLPGWKLVNILPELTKHAVNWIEDSARGGKPFFLYFALTSPHSPVVPAPEFRGKSQAGEYGDFVVQTDWTVGQVLDALNRSGVAGNTLVIVTSDNGPEIIEINPGAYEIAHRYGHYSMGPLRGVKRDTWEGGHRVPFFARWPGRIRAGAVSDEIICHADFMATIAALLGVQLPDNAGEDSFNLLPELCGEKYTSPIREVTVYHTATGKFGLRKGDWVLIDSPTGDAYGGEPVWFRRDHGYNILPDTQPGQLFNLRRDLPERKNLYAEQPEKVQELKALLEKYKRDGRSRH